MGTMYGSVLGVIILILDIWAIAQVLGSNISYGNKLLWVLLIVILPVLGLIIWMFMGPRSSSVV